MEALEIPLSDYELERGKPAPSLWHNLAQVAIACELQSRLRHSHNFAMELNLELKGRKLIPDIAIFLKLTPNMQQDVLWVQEAPLTTVEILTMKQPVDSLIERAGFFLAAGVKSCWIVIPAVSTIAVLTGPETYRSFASGSVVVDEVLGVEIPLADIFS